MIKHESKIVPKGFNGITLWPHIYIAKSKIDIIKKRGQLYYNKLINHESIHLPQQKEMLVLLFYVIYGLHYLINIIKYRNKYSTKKRRNLMAYRNICFEREAKLNEQNLDYLKTRKMYSWAKYLKDE